MTTLLLATDGKFLSQKLQDFAKQATFETSRNYNLLVSQTMKPIAKCLPTFEHGIGFLRQNQLY